jgi:hypothetical protein
LKISSSVLPPFRPERDSSAGSLVDEHDLLPADAEGFRAFVAAKGRKIGMHPGADVNVEPWIAVFGAENNMDDDLTLIVAWVGIVAKISV